LQIETSKMKVAIIAYSCEPNKGSEPGVAWDFIEEMNRRGHELFIFTKADKKHIIANSNLNDLVSFQFVNSPNVWLKRKLVPLRILHYYLWNVACLLYFKRGFRASEFDIVHHVTFVNDWMPSAGAFFGPRFIIGPIGRHPNLPVRYLACLKVSDALREVFRRVSRGIFGAMSLFTQLMLRRAETIFVINEDSIKNRFKFKTKVLPAIAINLQKFGLSKYVEKKEKPFRLYWAGNFIYWKAPEIAIRSFLKARKTVLNLELHMFGANGDFSKISTKYANIDGLFFHGKKQQEDFFERIIKMDAFLYPSFEGGGMVVLEAMASGKPVIGIRFGGLSQMVTNQSGILVDFVDFKTTIADLEHGIIKLSQDRNLLAKLSRGALKRVHQFSIIHKCDVIENIWHG